VLHRIRRNLQAAFVCGWNGSGGTFSGLLAAVYGAQAPMDQQRGHLFFAAVDVVLAVFSTMLLVVFFAALFRGELAWADTVLSMCILSFTVFVVLRFMLLWRAYRVEGKR